MRSNTQKQGVDPAGAFSPARHIYRPSIGWRLLCASALAAGFIAGMLAWALSGGQR